MPFLLTLLRVLLSLLAAVIPILLWVRLIWWCDRYEREPAGLLLLAFIWGALPAVILSIGIEGLLGGNGEATSLFSEVLSSSGVAPVVEELTKGVALLLILLIGRSEFDDLLDGILYGALIGFGFAMTENFLYYLSSFEGGGWGDWSATVFLRGLMFGLNHAFFTAFTGAGLGYAAHAAGQRRRRWVPLLGLSLAIVAHAAHNLGASLTSLTPLALLASFVIDLGGVLLVAVMAGLALRQESRWIGEELAGEVGIRLTAGEYEQLRSLRGRRQMLAAAGNAQGWRGVVAAQRFQEAATELAFRRRRLRVRNADDRLAVQAAVAAEKRLDALRGGPASLKTA